MSHDIAYTSQHPWLFPLATLSPLSTVTTIHHHHYPPQCPARHPPNRSTAFHLERVRRLRPMSPDVAYTSHNPMALLLTTPLPPSSLVPNKAPPNPINDILT